MIYLRFVFEGRLSFCDKGGELASLAAVARTSSTVQRLGEKYIALVGMEASAWSFHRTYRTKIRIGNKTRAIHDKESIQSILKDVQAMVLLAKEQSRCR